MPSEFSRIGIGTVQLGMDYGISNVLGKPSHDEISKIFKVINELGIELLDTASAYGESEIILGEFKKENHLIVSKWIENPLELGDSLNNLKCNKIYGWLAHRPMKLLDNKFNWEVMNSQAENGLVEKIGFSVSDPSELEELLNNDIIPGIVQFPFNIVDHRFEKWLDPLKKLGVEIHCRSIFLQGLFFMNPESLDPFFDPIKEWLIPFKKNNPSKLKLMAVLMLSVLQRKEIDRIILGINNSSELNEINEALLTKASYSTVYPSVPDEILNPSKWPRKKST